MRKSVAAVALSLLLIGCRTGKTTVVRNTDSVSVAKTERSERVALSALGNLEAEVREVPFIVPDRLQPFMLRKLLEQAVASKVLEIIYEGDNTLTIGYGKRFARLLYKAKQLFSEP